MSQADVVMATTEPDDTFTNSQEVALVAACKQQEYETEFLGFTPEAFPDALYNVVLDTTYNGFSAMQTFLKEKFPGRMTDEEFDKVSQTVLPIITAAIGKAFDKLQMYTCESIFRVPAHVSLPEDEVSGLTSGGGDDDERSMTEKIQRLKERIKEEKYYGSCLKEELNTLDMVEIEMNKLQDFEMALQQILTSNGVPDLKETMLFLKSQIQDTFTILDRMKPLPLPPVRNRL